MQYLRPEMIMWDLEEDEDVVTGSLNPGGNNEEGGNDDGDFDGEKVDWF